MRALEAAAAGGEIISADTLRDDPYQLPEPRNSSQWGALFRSAQVADLIRPVGYATSTTPSRHGGVLRLWRGQRTVLVYANHAGPDLSGDAA